MRIVKTRRRKAIVKKMEVGKRKRQELRDNLRHLCDLLEEAKDCVFEIAVCGYGAYSNSDYSYKTAEELEDMIYPDWTYAKEFLEMIDKDGVIVIDNYTKLRRMEEEGGKK